MGAIPEPTFTELFHRGQQGDLRSRSLAYALVVSQLRMTAARLLNRESRCLTLQPTALVNELFVKLHRLQCRVLNREHFLALAARSMRQVLVDHGRGKAVRRRHDASAAREAVPISESTATLAVRQVWERLRGLDPAAAEAVWLLKADGLTLREIAERQQRPLWRVHADIDFALDWMSRHLT